MGYAYKSARSWTYVMRRELSYTSEPWWPIRRIT